MNPSKESLIRARALSNHHFVIIPLQLRAYYLKETNHNGLFSTRTYIAVVDSFVASSFAKFNNSFVSIFFSYIYIFPFWSRCDASKCTCIQNAETALKFFEVLYKINSFGRWRPRKDSMVQGWCKDFSYEFCCCVNRKWNHQWDELAKSIKWLLLSETCTLYKGEIENRATGEIWTIVLAPQMGRRR